ncbi:MAG: trypsin-like serine protease [Planctomycetota bacterium]
MQRQTWTIAVVLLLLVGSGAVPVQAIVVRDTQNDSLYRTLGSSVPYESVGQFMGTTTKSGFMASGTLVSPEWVLTAAHVVDNAKTISFSIGGQTYQVDRKIVYPGWNGNLWSGYDIGLVHLAKPVDNIKPAQLYTGTSELNQADTVVGFGKTGTGNSGDTKSDGLKRGAQNVISQIEHKRLLVADFDNPLPVGAVPLGYSRALPLEGLIAPGDSGGGLFITTSTGTYLAGVNSFVGSDFGRPRSVYGNFSGHTRVSAFSDWIEALVRGEDPVPIDASEENSTSPSTTSPRLAAYPAPEPGSLTLLAAAAMMLGISRYLLSIPKVRRGSAPGTSIHTTPRGC